MRTIRRPGLLLLLLLALTPSVAFAHPEPGDVDGDGVRDEFDNCVNTRNADQTDTDGDRQGDRCDTDADADGIANKLPYLTGGDDNCPLVPNPDQTPADEDDRFGEACYEDTDLDGHPDPLDNCPNAVNPDQLDYDFDRTGDVCDLDDDDDGDFDASDNCQFVYNWEQTDQDGDGIGAACDANDAPPAGPSPPTGSAPPDVTAPTLALTMPRTLRLRELGPTIAVEVRCNERCALRAELIVKRRKVAAGTAALGGRGTTYVFMRRLRRLAPAKATLRLRATDAAGNVSTATRRIALRR
jgi:hypothetical protein